jgi:hypothetical protein
MRYLVLTAFFSGRAQVNGALALLLERGVPCEAISVLPKEVAHLDDLGVKVTSKASEGAALGAVLGGFLGALIGALGAGGALVIPGLAAVVAGPFVSALAGAGALGCAGTLIGALAGARLPEYEAAYLDDAIQRGGSLLAVRCLEERAPTIAQILVATGARRIRHGPVQLGDELSS